MHVCKKFIVISGIILGSLSFQSLGCCNIHITNNGPKTYDVTQSNPPCIHGSFRIVEGSDAKIPNRIHPAKTSKNFMRVSFDSDGLGPCSVRIKFHEIHIKLHGTHSTDIRSCFFLIGANEWGETKLTKSGCEPEGTASSSVSNNNDGEISLHN